MISQALCLSTSHIYWSFIVTSYFFPCRLCYLFFVVGSFDSLLISYAYLEINLSFFSDISIYIIQGKEENTWQWINEEWWFQKGNHWYWDDGRRPKSTRPHTSCLYLYPVIGTGCVFIKKGPTWHESFIFSGVNVVVIVNIFRMLKQGSLYKQLS